jgi:hypothetical protein
MKVNEEEEWQWKEEKIDVVCGVLMLLFFEYR